MLPAILLICAACIVQSQGNVLNIIENLDCDQYESCKSMKPSPHLYYIRSVGESSTIHFVSAFISNFNPSVLILETDSHAQLNVNWTGLTETENRGQFIFFTNGSVSNALGLELTGLHFMDTKKNRTLYKVPLDTGAWATQVDKNSTSSFLLNSQCSENCNGNINFNFGIHDSEGRSETIPRLQYLPSTFLFQVILNNIKFSLTNSTDLSIFMECSVAYSSGGNTTVESSKYVNFNDEFTPGVFEVSCCILSFDCVYKCCSIREIYCEYQIRIRPNHTLTGNL